MSVHPNVRSGLVECLEKWKQIIDGSDVGVCVDRQALRGERTVVNHFVATVSEPGGKRRAFRHSPGRSPIKFRAVRSDDNVNIVVLIQRCKNFLELTVNGGVKRIDSWVHDAVFPLYVVRDFGGESNSTG